MDHRTSIICIAKVNSWWNIAHSDISICSEGEICVAIVSKYSSASSSTISTCVPNTDTTIRVYWCVCHIGICIDVCPCVGNSKSCDLTITLDSIAFHDPSNIESISGVCYSNTNVSSISVNPVSDIELVWCRVRDIWLRTCTNKYITCSGCEIWSCSKSNSYILASSSIVL